MAEASEETNFCTNCKKDIAAANYLMHTMHCQRNIMLCKKCNEPVPRNEIEDHDKEMHSQVICKKCSKVMECWELEEHKSLCAKRTVQCFYCELECSLDEMKEHESYCGSRTEVCPLCKHYVMIKDKQEHELRNCTRKPTQQFVKNENLATDNFGTIIPCEFCGDFFPDIALIEHQSTCRSKLLPEFDFSIERGESYPEDIPCEFCGDWFPFELLILHQSGCRPDLVHQSQFHGSDQPDEKTVSLIKPSNQEQSLIPCEFCHNKFLPAALTDHQSLCGITNLYGSNVLENGINSFQGDLSHPEDIPCEFCGELFPIELLIGHQAVCNDNNLDEILSDQLYPVAESEISRISTNNISEQSRKHQDSPKLEDILSVRTDNIVKPNDLSEERNLKTFHNPEDKLSTKKDTSKSEYFKIDKKWLEKPSEATKPREFINIDTYFQRWDRKQCFSKDIRHVTENRTVNERTYNRNTQREYDSHFTRQSYEDDRISAAGAQIRNSYREKENWSNEQKMKSSPRNVDTYSYERPTRIKNMSSFSPLYTTVSGSQQQVDERIFEGPTRRPHQLQPLSPDDGNSKNKCTKRKVKSSRED